MKSTILILLLFFFTNVFSQDNPKTSITKEDAPTKEIIPIKEEGKVEDIQKDSKISFIVGIGGSFITNDIYNHPQVNATTNNVVLDKAQSFKSNLTLGIAYINSRLIREQQDGNKYSVPYGLTLATFINPISFNQFSDNQDFFNMLDFGVGVGWKFSGDMLILGTVEFFSVRQPRDYFIEEFSNNDKQYVIDDNVQMSFDSNDDNIFKSKIVPTIGIKICYTFDIISNFRTAAKTVVDSEKAEKADKGKSSDDNSNVLIKNDTKSENEKD